MRRLEDLLEHGGVKVLAPQDVLLARLLDLDDDGDDEEDEDDAAGHANDGAVGVVEVVQDVGFPFFCAERRKWSILDYRRLSLQHKVENFLRLTATLFHSKVLQLGEKG